MGYRADDRNLVVGADGVWDHVLFPHGQVGYTIEQSVATLGPQAIRSSRGVAYARYVMMYGDSLYLQPFHYVEVFGLYQNRSLPDPYVDRAGRAAVQRTTRAGRPLPPVPPDAVLGPRGRRRDRRDVPVRLADCRQHANVPGAVRPVLVRQADAAHLRLDGARARWYRGSTTRAGRSALAARWRCRRTASSSRWAAATCSAAWAWPTGRATHSGSAASNGACRCCSDLNEEYCDHVAGLRNVYLAPFYDVGAAYLSHKQIDNVAQAVGVGLRLDVVWVGMIERTTVRLDFAKTINAQVPWQFWFGVQQPF